MNYQSSEQRVMASFCQCLGDFHGYETDVCSQDEQRALYEFLQNVFKAVYDEPELLFTTLHEDYSLRNIFTVDSDENKAMLPIMRKARGVMYDLMSLLIDIGKNGSFDTEKVTYSGKVNSRFKTVLARCGVTAEKNTYTNTKIPFLNALRWFANEERVNPRRLSICAFDPEYDYLTPVLTPLLEKEEGSVKLIISWLTAHGYSFVDGNPKLPSTDDLCIHYFKHINPKKEQPLGTAFMGDKFHLGFSIEYRYTRTNPVFCTVRTVKIDEILKDFDVLSPRMQAFITNTLHQCNECGYCNQTNKSRPRAIVPVKYQNTNIGLCPILPGFSFSFRSITREEAENIIEYMELLEKYNM